MDSAFDVVFVCTGNRFRSVLGAEAFREAVNGVPVRVASYGTLDLGPVEPLPGALREARVLGLDLSTHRARSLDMADLSGADLVIGFELKHVVAALNVAHAPLERTFMLTELVELLTAGDAPTGAGDASQVVALAHAHRSDPQRRRSIREIADPIDMGDSDQRAVARTVYDSARTVARHIFGTSAG
jgi:protein-tyrosine-phosphatase